jgi:oligoendopeptidase F
MMDREKEALSADLAVDGINAWGRLYDTISAKLEFEMAFPDGHVERVPISKRRSLLEHPDRGIRKAAFEGGNRAWQSVEDVTCAAINAISGTRLTLNRHRGVKHFLDMALFQSAISRKTLEAMREAIYAKIELPREILRTKAQAMGETKIRWYDLGAPTTLDAETSFSWDEAKELITGAFRKIYPKFADFFCSLYTKKWVEWEPRAGKRPGGFCTASMLSGESRIFMTYNGGLGDMLTLAHEAGHAFHNHLINGVRPFSQLYPMTIAECASTFGELLLQRGLLEDPRFAGKKKATVLDMETSHGAIYLLDITVRFEFERALYEERASGELSVSRLKEIMTETQRELFGDVLEEGWEDPYYWSSKLHFYITGITFYNFPYTFGYLLSRGLYGMLKKEGVEFLPKYEEFLRLAGSGTATEIARKCLGLDLETPEFWAEAIETLREPLDQMRSIMNSKGGE